MPVNSHRSRVTTERAGSLIPQDPSLGPRIGQIALDTIHTQGGTGVWAPKFTNNETIATYNILTHDKPTILVPGAPPKWSPLPGTQKFDEDTDSTTVNYNHKFKYPMEAALRAIYYENPNYKARDVDIFATGSILEQLILFADGGKDGFRFNVQIIGRTMFFVTNDNSVSATGQEVRGYGVGFPKMHIAWDKETEGSHCHQRLTQCRFDQLSMVIQYEGHGYLEKEVPNIRDEIYIPRDMKEKDIVEMIKNLEANKRLFAPEPPPTGMIINSGGRKIAQDALLDIRVRPHEPYLQPYNLDTQLVRNEVPRLYVSKPKWVAVATPEDGKFNKKKVKIENAEKTWNNWEERLAGLVLYKLFVIILRIGDYAKSTSNGRLEIYKRPNVSILDVRRQPPGEKDALPEDLKAKWMGMSDSGGVAALTGKFPTVKRITWSSDEEPDYKEG